MSTKTLYTKPRAPTDGTVVGHGAKPDGSAPRRARYRPSTRSPADEPADDHCGRVENHQHEHEESERDPEGEERHDEPEYLVYEDVADVRADEPCHSGEQWVTVLHATSEPVGQIAGAEDRDGHEEYGQKDDQREESASPAGPVRRYDR